MVVETVVAEFSDSLVVLDVVVVVPTPVDPPLLELDVFELVAFPALVVVFVVCCCCALETTGVAHAKIAPKLQAITIRISVFSPK